MLSEPADAAPCRGRLSVRSPVGAALIGLPAGHSAVVDTPTGRRRYRLVAVGAAPRRDEPAGG